MTIEINEGQRFPQQFIQAVAAVGGVALLLAAVFLPFSQLGFPVLLLALLAVQVSARYDSRPKGGWHFPFTEGFIFLSMLLFEGEVAVIAAALVAFCCALAGGRGWWAVGFRAGSATVAATLAVWTMRLTSGPLSGLTEGWPAPSTLNGACAAVLLLSL